MARGISLRDFRPEDAAAVHRWFNSPAATANLLEHRDEFTEDDAGAGSSARSSSRRSGRRGPQVGDRGRGHRRAGRLHGALRAQPADGAGARGDHRRRARARQGRRPRGGAAHQPEGLRGVRRPQGLRPHPRPNEAAKKAVIYNGWKQEGVLRRHVRHGDELIDVELWGGFREDLPEPPEE